MLASWRQPTLIQVTQVNSHNAFAIDDSTINIVLMMLLLLLLNAVVEI